MLRLELGSKTVPSVIEGFTLAGKIKYIYGSTKSSRRGIIYLSLYPNNKFISMSSITFHSSFVKGIKLV